MSAWRHLWLVLTLLGLGEAALRLCLAEDGPPRRDLSEAAAFLRVEYRPGDLVVVAPRWFAQGRAALGPTVLPLSDQARPDESTYLRLWELSIRGASAEEARGLTPELERASGEVRLRRFALTPTAMDLFDFVGGLDRATVSAERAGVRRPCARERGAPRVRCGEQGADEWVGRETISDLDHRPRRCIWAHPLPGKQALRIDFGRVARGTRIEGHTATDYVVGRWCRPAVVGLAVELDGRVAGRVQHQDCDGWKPFAVEVPPGEPEVAVAFVVDAPDPRDRNFCFQAQMRRGR